MIFAVKFFSTILPLLYLALLYLYGVYFFRTPRWVEPYLPRLLNLTIIVHLFAVFARGIYLQRFPLANTFEVLTMLALALTLIYAFIEIQLKIKTTGFFIFIVVFVLQLISTSFIDYDPHLPDILKSRMFLLHTTGILIGYAALFVSALYSIMYLLLFYQIKNAQFGVVYSRLPALDDLDEMNSRAALIGFVFLSAAIFIGLIWRKDEFPGTPHFDPKVVMAYLVWVIYGVLLVGKQFAGWRGKSLAYLSVCGFLVILFSMFFANLFLDTFHQF